MPCVRTAALSFALTVFAAIFPSGRAAADDAALFRKSGFQARVSLGRIHVAASGNWSPRSLAIPRDPKLPVDAVKNPTVESLLVQGPDAPLVRYVNQRGDGEYLFEWRGDGSVVVRQQHADHTVELIQPATGPVVFSIRAKPPTDGDATDRAEDSATAASVWHLWLERPEFCGRWLPELFAPIRPQERLGDTMAEALAILTELSPRDQDERRGRWKRHVEALASSDYEQRQAADRALRADDVASWSWLSRLDRSRLAPEARRRATAILDEVRATRADTPQRIAAWLAEDVSAWSALLASQVEATRVAAVEHLERLTGRSVDFDPTANEEQRAARLPATRAALARNESQ